MEYIIIWSRIKTLVLALSVGFSVIGQHGAAAKVVEGDTFPDLSNFEFEGEVPEIEGKVVLVDFWASWCAPCKASFPAMERLYQEFKDRGFEIIAVSVDDSTSAYSRFANRSGATFPIVRDLEKKLVATCAIEAMPTSFMLDKSGQVHAVHQGYSGKKTEDQYRKEILALLAED